jgi:hypothetical protein
MSPELHVACRSLRAIIRRAWLCATPAPGRCSERKLCVPRGHLRARWAPPPQVRPALAKGGLASVPNSEARNALKGGEAKAKPSLAQQSY